MFHGWKEKRQEQKKQFQLPPTYLPAVTLLLPFTVFHSAGGSGPTLREVTPSQPFTFCISLLTKQTRPHLPAVF